MNLQRALREISVLLKENVPKYWDGRKSILQMKREGFPHWKQMEWIGFYFQFLCEKFLKEIMQIPGPKYGNVRFDGFYTIPWDLKAHAMNTSSHQVIVNDREAISDAINDFGAIGLILAIGKVLYNDEDRTFQKWHERLKGGKSEYELERIKRGAWSRLRKVSFDLQQISFIRITDETLIRSGSFQGDFRNADGKPRREKVLIDLEEIDRELIKIIRY